MHLNNILLPNRGNFPGAPASKRLPVLSKATLETAIGKKSFPLEHILSFRSWNSNKAKKGWRGREAFDSLKKYRRFWWQKSFSGGVSRKMSRWVSMNVSKHNLRCQWMLLRKAASECVRRGRVVLLGVEGRQKYENFSFKRETTSLTLSPINFIIRSAALNASKAHEAKKARQFLISYQHHSKMYFSR